jgi:PIN domain nuclease of toxin-antitoxin system
MQSVVIDTHVAIWYVTDVSKISAKGLQAMDGATQAGLPIYVSSIELVEMRYLVEKGKIAQLVLDRVNAALDQPNANLEIISLDLRISRTIGQVSRTEIPDMPDRIIAATAYALGLPLISRDRKIQASAIQTIW